MLFVLPICWSPRVLPAVLPRQGSAVELLLEKKKFKRNYLLVANIDILGRFICSCSFCTLRQDFCSFTQSAPASAAAAIIFLASLTSPLEGQHMLDQSFSNHSSFAYLARNNHLMVLPQLCNDKDRMVVTNPSSRTELDLWHIQPENGSCLDFFQSQGKT